MEYSIFWRTVRRLTHLERSFKWKLLGDKVKSVDIKKPLKFLQERRNPIKA